MPETAPSAPTAATRRLFLRAVAVSAFDIGTAASAAPALLLARDAGHVDDPSRYLISEKLDGVRALWDARALRFRSGRQIAVPAWFTAALPDTPLDGELWTVRGDFDTLSGIVRKAQPLDDEWRKVHYQAFEMPGGEGDFAARHERLQRVVAQTNFVQLSCVEQHRGTTQDALQRQLNAVVAAGGEGLMLHLADAPYVTGRHDALLKLKPMQDREAVVVGHMAGRGRHAGRLGALRVRDDQGRVFLLGTGLSDAQRDDPPPIGSTVTYIYRGQTPSGAPRFASFLRLHHAL